VFKVDVVTDTMDHSRAENNFVQCTKLISVWHTARVILRSYCLLSQLDESMQMEEITE
jgi:hypothetical protein